MFLLFIEHLLHDVQYFYHLVFRLLLLCYFNKRRLSLFLLFIKHTFSDVQCFLFFCQLLLCYFNECRLPFCFYYLLRTHSVMYSTFCFAFFVSYCCATLMNVGYLFVFYQLLLFYFNERRLPFYYLLSTHSVVHTGFLPSFVFLSVIAMLLECSTYSSFLVLYYVLAFGDNSLFLVTLNKNFDFLLLNRIFL